MRIVIKSGSGEYLGCIDIERISLSPRIAQLVAGSVKNQLNALFAEWQAKGAITESQTAFIEEQ